MGQKIQIASVRIVGDIASYTTDRNVSSQDGETFAKRSTTSVIFSRAPTTSSFGARVDGMTQPSRRLLP